VIIAHATWILQKHLDLHTENNTVDNREVEKWKLADLKTHPKQAQYFKDLPQQQLRRLAQSMLKGYQAIEILPDGTILKGHQRVLAAKSLGWDAIDAVVRHDLQGQGEDAAEEALLEDNLCRRQLDPIEKAHGLKRLKELWSRRPNQERGGLARGDFRDYLGSEFRMSGRSVDRLLRLLQAPVEVQHAVSDGRLAAGLAEKVAGLPPAKREEVAAAIRAGDKPREVVRRFVPTVKRKHKKAWKALVAFEKVLEQGLADLEGRLDEVGPIWPEEQDILKRAGALIEQLLEQARRQPTEQPSLEEELRAAAEDFHNGAPDQFGALDTDE
jgi:ParB family chromosome partitioning protein